MYRIVSWPRLRQFLVLGLAAAAIAAAAGAALSAGLAAQPTAAAVTADGTVCVPILMYHGVLEDSSRQGQYVISPQLLESDLAALRDRGYTTVLLRDLIDYVDGLAPLPERPIVLTFDDGYYNNYLYAYPLLRRYGMRAVISPVVSWSEKFSLQDSDHAVWSHLTWDELREMADSGTVELASHTYDMHYCRAGMRKGTLRRTGEAKDAYAQALRTDLQKAQRLLTEHTGVTPTAFAYPYGAMCADAAEVIRSMGFRATLSCESRVCRITHDPECLTALGRYLRPAGVDSRTYFDRIDAAVTEACKK